MATVSERERARLALRLLECEREPDAGDHVLIWARIEAPEDHGRLLASVTTRLRSRAYGTQRFLIDRSDVVLATAERPA
jgi:hypothetical protein